MKHTSIYWGWLINKTFATGQTVILVIFINNHFIVQRLLSGVPWVISAFGALIFFEEEGSTVTITSDCYCEMLERFLCPKVIWLLTDHNPDNVWFQQDGATSHSSRCSLRILCDMFPGHLVSLWGDIGWPPHSLDLTPCDLFLWRHIKSQVYQHQLANLKELKAATTHEINAIPQDMVERAMINFRERLQNCINIGGCHLSGTIFKTT